MHFTYVQQPDRDNLHQGDVLERTPELDEVLAQVHPHYHGKPDYGFFAVLTQSCDLVRRDGVNCSSRYVTICAVRPFELVLRRFVDSVLYDDLERAFSFSDERRKEKLKQFIVRLMNNNEDPYFYLHREVSAGFPRDQCAFLRLSIALKTELHYETLLEAKILQLKESFEHKLGFLVGTVYSRVGTEDWTPGTLSVGEFRAEVSRRADQVKEVAWLDRETHKRLLKRLKQEDDPDLEKYAQVLGEVKQQRSQRLAEALSVVKQNAEDLLAKTELERLLTRLENDAAFKGYVR